MTEQRETEQQRLTRNVNELLAELRVAQAGVQILFGFLLAVVFTPMFAEAELLVKVLHLAAVLLAVLATALLSAPAAWHRMLFREGLRRQILADGNRVVLAGLVCLALAVTVTVALIGFVVFGVVALGVLAALTAACFGYLWFVAPRRLRRIKQDPPAGSRP
ncbi:DUF6328 family protein [Thermocrispum municipale]|jgi:O-antigen/teichoic acid export membrane protein|uniref:DUF6328 family protein n=1 Tax=Thermocrispum municipale TaxID=37926 RepID=UPI000401A8F4|nr:DUF6328 family protein [Thermocrispum municipale]